MIAALAFLYGVYAWKREHIGKRRIDLAEDVLSQFYETSEAIRAIRSPVLSGGEGQSRQKSEDEDKKTEEVLNRAHVPYERYQAREACFTKLFSMKYRYMAVFGKETGEAFDKMRSALNKIFTSARMLGSYYWARDKRTMRDEEIRDNFFKRQEKYENIFWDFGDDDDEIKEIIDKSISIIEKTTQEAMKTTWLERRLFGM